MSSNTLCLYCSRSVFDHHQAIDCDSCGGWQHRACNTGISRYVYAKMKRGVLSRDFVCENCSQNEFQNEDSMETEPDLPTPIPCVTDNSLADLTEEANSLRVDHEQQSETESQETDSFNISASFTRPQQLEESSVAEPEPSSTVTEEAPTTYEIIEGGSLKGKNLLLESTGFAYTHKVKTDATSQLFVPAKSIVEKVFDNNVLATDFNLPNQDNLARRANRHRQRMRPKEPRGIDFELEQHGVPDGYLRHDLTVDGARHIIFATDTQLEVLQQAKRWYVDGTFKVLRQRDPFNQLYSIHAFLKNDNGDTKQVPLVFIFMSHRRKKDYKKVFKNLGLSGSYKNHEGTHLFLRKLFSLPLLPEEHIEPAFRHLQQKATEPLQPLMEYVESTWITGNWTPDEWSVYGQSIRTNNDCEGWHHRLNCLTSGPPAFYNLLELLHRESERLSVQMRLISERKLKKIQKKAARAMQARIFLIWDEYEAKNISTSKLLRKLSVFMLLLSKY